MATLLMHGAAAYVLFAHRPVAPAVVPPAPIMVRFVTPPEPPKPQPVTPPKPEPVAAKAAQPPKPKRSVKQPPPKVVARPEPKPEPEPALPRVAPPVINAAPQTPATASVPAVAEPSIPAREAPFAEVVAKAAPLAPPAPPAVIPPTYNADYLQNPAPRYPPLARRMRQQGKVLLRVLVNAGGTAAKIEVRQSSGSEMLDEAALDAVKRWRFVPARQGSDPVAAWVIVPITFTLQG